MSTMAQTQQMKVYAAEAVLPNGREFATEQEAQAFVDKLRETWWWSAFFWKGPERVEVYFRPRQDSVGSYHKDADAGKLEMGYTHRNVKGITHELAHVLAAAIHNSTSHDPYFARVYGVLTYAISGSQAWLALQRQFNELGVDYMQGGQDEIH